jgi:hypothetical protein
VTAVIAILVIHHWRDAFAMQPIRGSKPSHSTAKDNNVWFCHKGAPKSYCELKSPEKHSRELRKFTAGTFVYDRTAQSTQDQCLHVYVALEA